MDFLKKLTRWLGKYIVVWCLVAILTIVSLGLYKYFKRGS